MSGNWIVVVAALTAATSAPAAEPPNAKSAPSEKSSKALAKPAPLRRAVHEALRREATSSGARQQAAIKELVELFGEVKENSQLPDGDRTQLQALVRSRLQKAGRRLERGVDGTRLDAVLGQVAGGRNAANRPARGQSAAGSAPADDAQQLIDLIQTTIAPSTWDIHGGQGSIRYFEPGKVLVIRQTDEVHGRVGDTLRQVRDSR